MQLFLAYPRDVYENVVHIKIKISFFFSRPLDRRSDWPAHHPSPQAGGQLAKAGADSSQASDQKGTPRRILYPAMVKPEGLSQPPPLLSVHKK